MDKSRVERDALLLDTEDRAALAQALLLSLEEMSETEIREKWKHTVSNRAAQLDNGDVQAVSYEDVLAEVKVLLR